jgi:hypothetical protein
MADLSLPRMSDSNPSHIDDRDVPVKDTTSKICTLWLDDLIKSDDTEDDEEKEGGDQTDDNEDFTVVRMPLCGHLFHVSWIERWLGSTAEHRDRCSSCRADLC